MAGVMLPIVSLQARGERSAAARDSHERWSGEAFNGFCGPNSTTMPAAGIKRRQFSKWIRSFVADMVMTGNLALNQVVRTARIIDILFAKAQTNSDARFTAIEFDSFTRVITEPTDGTDLEAEIAWSLFDLDQSGRISTEDCTKLQALWAALGREALEESSFETAEEYYLWYNSCVSQMRSTRSTPLRAFTAPSTTTSSATSRLDTSSSWNRSNTSSYPSRMIFKSQMRPQDHVLRSAEASQLSLQESSFVPQAPRCITPSRSSKVKRPPAKRSTEANAHSTEQAATGPVATPRLPTVPKPLDWEAQNEWWTRKENRLRPYMEVKASYLRPDGSKVQGVGVLLNGWGIANKASTIPHATAPEGARLGDYRKNLSSSDASEEAGARVGSEAVPVTKRSEPWSEEVLKWKDAEKNVVVLIHGCEKLVPREWVRPVCTKRSPRQGMSRTE